MTLPLEGITVVALEQAVAAPFATRQLADLGARVLKVERVGGGDFIRSLDETVLGMSSHFAWLNRGKESVALDIKDATDQSLLAGMIAGADVFVQNLAPGAADRLGLAAPVLRERHPRLVICGISGYGTDGPYRHRKAYDLLVQCEAGVLSLTGTPEAPSKVGISIADIAGGMYAFSGILAGLYERERTGLGVAFEVSLLDALGEWMTQPYLFTAYGGSPPARTIARHASIAPYGPYRVGDGGAVFIGIQNDREWTVFCRDVLARPDVAGEPRFATNPSRVEHNDVLTTVIEQALSTMATAHVTDRLDVVGIAHARLRTMDEFAEHPQLAARDRWRDVDSPGGPVRVLLPPVTVPGRTAAMGPIPAVGQHTEAVRAEFGS